MRSRSQRGQSATELVLALPIIFAMLFAAVEVALWLGGTHYSTYAAFSAARAQQVGRDPETAASMLLDGRATSAATARGSGDRVTISMPWEADLPFASAIGDLSYEVTAVAGPDEEQYEGRSGTLSKRYGDNNCRGGC